MTALKGLVIGMGVLILAALGLLVYLLVARSTGSSPPAASLTLPQGARVVEMSGAGDGIALRLALPSGAERILMIDRRGKPTATLDLDPAR